MIRSMDGRRAFALLALALPLAVMGCGGDDGDSGKTSKATNQSKPVPREVLSPNPARPQMAFFRLQNSTVHDLAITDDRGRRGGVLTGDSIPGTPWPQLYTSISWSPDGKKLAFAGGEGERTGSQEEKTDVYVIEQGRSSGPRQVTDAGDVSSPLWSADGKRIVFTRSSVEGQLPRGELWSVKPDGSGLTRLTKREEGETDAAGSFSPDGDTLAVTRTTYNPDTRRTANTIYAMDADGSNEKELIAQGSEPSYSPDGKRILFETDRDRNGRFCIGGSCGIAGELYGASSNGRNLDRLTKTATINESSPAWSPNGVRIAYQAGGVSEERPGSGVFVSNADGSCPKRFLVDASLEYWYGNPVWRPTPEAKQIGRLRCRSSS
jgi:Tol biopolymer transport system component